MEATHVTYTMKDILLKQINENPGIRYRELLRVTNRSNGVLTYHLTALEKSSQIKVDRKSRITRYYPPDISTEKYDIIGCLRPYASRQIIIFMLKQELSTFNEIVEHTKKGRSTVSWHLQRLENSGIITAQFGRYTLYKLTNREAVLEILSKYKESFMDKVVDNYTEMIDEL